LSDADKRFVAELSDDDTPGNKPAVNLLRVLDIRGVLALNSAGTLRAEADRFLEQVLNSPVALNWGRAVARNRQFQARPAAINSRRSKPSSGCWRPSCCKSTRRPGTPRDHCRL